MTVCAREGCGNTESALWLAVDGKRFCSRACVVAHTARKAGE